MTPGPAPSDPWSTGRRPHMEGPPGPVTRLDGRPFLYFAGTGYLGLQADPRVIAAGCRALERFGVHSATSRALFGQQPPTLDVERLAARLYHAEDSFYFASGFAGPQVLLAALAADFDVAWHDEHAHYGLREALRLAGVPALAFAHRDPADLADRLRRHLRPGQRPLLVTDGVFPITGRLAPLADYWPLLHSYPGSGLLVDDAHALAVLGPNGRGTLEHFNLHSAAVNALSDPAAGPVRLVCATLSKAVGGSGGIIAGSAAFVRRLESASRWFDAASAPPAPVAGATAAALDILLAEPQLRVQLLANTRRLRAGLVRLGLPVDDDPTPIIPVVLDSAAAMRRLAAALWDQGLAIAYFASYSGVGPHGALRIAVFANHTPDQLDRLIDALAALL